MQTDQRSRIRKPSTLQRYEQFGGAGLASGTELPLSGFQAVEQSREGRWRFHGDKGSLQRDWGLGAGDWEIRAPQAPSPQLTAVYTALGRKLVYFNCV